VPVMVMRKGRGKSACVCTTVLGNVMAVIDVHTHTHILTNTDLGDLGGCDRCRWWSGALPPSHWRQRDGTSTLSLSLNRST